MTTSAPGEQKDAFEAAFSKFVVPSGGASFAVLTDTGPGAKEVLDELMNMYKGMKREENLKFVLAVRDFRDYIKMGKDPAEIEGKFGELKKLVGDPNAKIDYSMLPDPEINLPAAIYNQLTADLKTQEESKKWNADIFIPALNNIVALMHLNLPDLVGLKTPRLIKAYIPIDEIQLELEFTIATLTDRVQQAKSFFGRSDPVSNFLELIRKDAIKMQEELQALQIKIEKDPKNIKQYRKEYDVICSAHYAFQNDQMDRIHKLRESGKDKSDKNKSGKDKSNTLADKQEARILAVAELMTAIVKNSSPTPIPAQRKAPEAIEMTTLGKSRQQPEAKQNESSTTSLRGGS